MTTEIDAYSVLAKYYDGACAAMKGNIMIAPGDMTFRLQRKV
jgi:hypothetical protein